jgi:hypothetical protein
MYEREAHVRISIHKGGTHKKPPRIYEEGRHSKVHK